MPSDIMSGSYGGAGGAANAGKGRNSDSSSSGATGVSKYSALSKTDTEISTDSYMAGSTAKVEQSHGDAKGDSNTYSVTIGGKQEQIAIAGISAEELTSYLEGKSAAAKAAGTTDKWGGLVDYTRAIAGYQSSLTDSEKATLSSGLYRNTTIYGGNEKAVYAQGTKLGSGDDPQVVSTNMIPAKYIGISTGKQINTLSSPAKYIGISTGKQINTLSSPSNGGVTSSASSESALSASAQSESTGLGTGSKSAWDEGNETEFSIGGWWDLTKKNFSELADNTAKNGVFGFVNSLKSNYESSLGYTSKVIDSYDEGLKSWENSDDLMLNTAAGAIRMFTPSTAPVVGNKLLTGRADEVTGSEGIYAVTDVIGAVPGLGLLAKAGLTLGGSLIGTAWDGLDNSNSNLTESSESKDVDWTPLLAGITSTDNKDAGIQSDDSTANVNQDDRTTNGPSFGGYVPNYAYTPNPTDVANIPQGDDTGLIAALMAAISSGNAGGSGYQGGSGGDSQTIVEGSGIGEALQGMTPYILPVVGIIAAAIVLYALFKNSKPSKKGVKA